MAVGGGLGQAGAGNSLLWMGRVALEGVRLAAQGVEDDGHSAAEELLGNYAGDLAVYGVRAIEPALAIDEVVSEPRIRALAARRNAVVLLKGYATIVAEPGGR